MKITETIERECCMPRDMEPVVGTPKVANGTMYRYMFCKYCGHHQIANFRLGEWMYERLPVPWWKP